MQNTKLTGKIVKFTGKEGNEFHTGDIAVCLNGEEGLFLGLSGYNFGRIYYESMEFEVVETSKNNIEELLSDSRKFYFEGKAVYREFIR